MYTSKRLFICPTVTQGYVKKNQFEFDNISSLAGLPDIASYGGGSNTKKMEEKQTE